MAKTGNKITLLSILKDSQYNLFIFTPEEITLLEKKITEKKGKPYIECIIRGKEILLKPEEIVRQLYTAKLIKDYNYPKKRIKFEHPIQFGRQTKSADIVIFDKDRPTVEYIIVEVKKPKLKDGKEQLKSYCNATGAPIGVWTNGGQISHYNRKDPNYFNDITDIPNASQTLEDILKERFTWRDLVIKDRLLEKKHSLKKIIEEMEDEVLANAGVDVFEEAFKLIFTKLYDETQSKDDKVKLDSIIEINLSDIERSNYYKLKEFLQTDKTVLKLDKKFRVLEFRNTGQSEGDLKKKIQKLFDESKKKWTGVFPDESKIDLSPSHLSICISSLQDVKLFNSNLQVIDEAFEYLVSKSSKGEKGQYFTPRHVIDMCVKILNPKRGEYMVDTASGSCGFTVHTIFHLTGHLFENTEITQEEKEDVLKVFGIDFDEKVVRVARTINLIAGDGETNVLHLNSLDYERWNETVNNQSWLMTYGKGFKRFKALKKKNNSNGEFLFDILMANPPFAGDIKESRIIHKYELGYNSKGKPKSKVGRDILFIERNLDFIKPGGRMAIVLPQGRFNNTSEKDIREFIADKARILAVVGLHGNTFKPHTGTKTSILFVQKWHDKFCPKKDDYPIFLAVSEKSGKDNSGEYINLKNGVDKNKLDKYNHLIIDHDLHNHNGELPDGIAEAFIDWAKKEKLSFGNKAMKVSVISLLDNVGNFRLDAEAYLPIYYENEEILYQNKLTTLGIECSTFSKGIFDIKAECYIKENGVPFVRINNLGHIILNDNEIIHIPISENEKYKNTYLKRGDLIISKTAYPAASFVDIKCCNVSQDIIAIKLKKEAKIKSHYLAVFLNSKYGFLQMQRWFTGNVQMHLNLPDSKGMLIPIMDDKFQELIEILIEKAIENKKKSSLSYIEAEQALLNELMLLKWKAEKNLSFVKNYSDIMSASRIDAEYYQPMYDEIINKTKTYKNGHDILGNKANIKDENFIPKGNTVYKYIELANISTNGNITGFTEVVGKELPTRARRKVNNGDVIVSSIEGSLSSIALITDSFNDALCSTGFYVINSESINSETLLVMLKSIVGQLQLKKGCSGTILTAISKDEFQRIVLPKIDEKAQIEIKSKIAEMYKSKDFSKRLLDIAKRGVELAIEKDEKKAENWINSKLFEYGIGR